MDVTGIPRNWRDRKRKFWARINKGTYPQGFLKMSLSLNGPRMVLKQVLVII